MNTIGKWNPNVLYSAAVRRRCEELSLAYVVAITWS